MVAGDGPSLFDDGRLVEPIGYVNAQAGYFLLGFWPLLATAAAARSRLLSGGAVAGACLLGGLVLLTQTRAAPLAFAITAVLVVALLPGRTRRLWVLVAVLAGVAATSPLLLDVYTARGAGGTPDSGTVRIAALALLGGAAAHGRGLGRRRLGDGALGEEGDREAASRDGLDRRALADSPSPRWPRWCSPVGNPVEQARAGGAGSFVNLDAAEQRPSGSTRFATAGGNRYDYWRIAVDEFASAPLGGLGAGNYTRDYFVERRTIEDVTQPHSLELQTLAELGLAGIAAPCSSSSVG